jgi:hypothetical protein
MITKQKSVTQASIVSVSAEKKLFRSRHATCLHTGTSNKQFIPHSYFQKFSHLKNIGEQR